MLSSEAWWAIMEAYGRAIWPLQIVALVLSAGVALAVFARPGVHSDRLVRLYLMLAFGWIGIVFFLTMGRQLVGSAVFGSLFVIVALVFAIDVVRGEMTFRPPTAGLQRGAAMALTGLVLAYPAISLLIGHAFPRTIYTGSFPCPTTAFGLLLLTFALPNASRLALGLLLVWALPFPLFVQIPRYGVYEDTIMFAVGLYALAVWVSHLSARGGALPGPSRASR